MADRYWVGNEGPWDGYDCCYFPYRNDGSGFSGNWQAVGAVGVPNGVGQSFTGNGGILAGINFYLKKYSGSTGNAYAKIYTHDGTYGTSSIPIDSALATSDALDISTLGTSGAYVLLNFSGINQITLTNETNYVVTIEFTGNNSNYIYVLYDSSGVYSGNYSSLTSGVWTATSTKDAGLYVYTLNPHWATTSGGVPDISYCPNENDNTIFDENSFTLPNQRVYCRVHQEDGIMPNNGYYYDFNCINMDWSKATNSPILDLVDSGIVMSGNLTLCEDMEVDAQGDLYYNIYQTSMYRPGIYMYGLSGNTYYIDTKNVSFKGTLYVDRKFGETGKPKYILNNNLTLYCSKVIRPAVRGAFDGILEINNCDFDANGYDITCLSIIVWPDSEISCIANFGDGKITFTGHICGFDCAFNTTNIISTGKIIFNLYHEPSIYETNYVWGYFGWEGTVYLNQIEINLIDSGVDDYFNIGNDDSSKSFTTNDSINKIIFNNWGQSDNEYIYFSGYSINTTTINNIVLKGTPSHYVLINIDGTPGDEVWLKNSGVVNFSYLRIEDSTVGGGATWYACNCVDAGNNYGFTWTCEPSYFTLEGEPVMTGVYTLGNHSPSYPIVLDMTYPISDRQDGELVLDGVEIGAILVIGQEFYVSWKRTYEGAETYGIDKLDLLNKLDKAFFETRVLSGNREQMATFRNFIMSYAELPTGTDITLKYSKDYGTNWTTMTRVNDTNRRLIYANSEGIEASTLAIRGIITASSNDAPSIERGDIILE